MLLIAAAPEGVADEELALLRVQAGSGGLEACRISPRHWLALALAAGAAAAVSAAASCRQSWRVLGGGPDSFEPSSADHLLETVALEGGCRDDPAGWRSAGGGTCEDYSSKSWCTPKGGYGKSWDRDAHGNFERWATDGYSAVEACCACGGGSRGTPKTTTTTPAATTSTAAAAAKHAGSAPCSWAYQNCTESKCCRGYGMQCYKKDDNWATCKQSCTPGTDPWDQDKKPWSCQKLGERTPGPGGEDTCNFARDSPDFWSGKVLHSSDAASTQLCNQDCASKAWCGVWSWSKTNSSNGSCLLAPRASMSQDSKDGKQPRCRLASADLPAHNCSGRGEDCSSSRCCRVHGEQCYKKDDKSAVCRSRCRKDNGWSCEELGPRVCPACRPPSTERPAVVIPTYERDLCKAIILMKSIVKRDPRHLLGDVHVMWVSEEPSWKYSPQIDEMRRAIVGAGGRQFHLLDFSEPVRRGGSNCLAWSENGTACIISLTGWYAQQALKLKISNLITSEYYLLLDSKNAFFSDIQEDSFFSSCNQAFVQGKYLYDDIPHPHDEWYASSSKALGVEPAKDIFWPTSITPAVLHRQTVLELLKHIGEDPNPYNLCTGPLCTWFAQGKTEFTLYNIWAFSKADRGCMYSFLSPISDEKETNVALWRGWTEEDNLQRCEEVATGNVKALTFGLQANCLQRTNMTDAGGKLKGEGKDRKKPEGAARDRLLTRTSECLFRIYKDVGLADGSKADSDVDHEEFTKCVS